MIDKRQHINDKGEIVNETFNRYPDAMTDEGYRIPSHKLGARLFADVQFPKEMLYIDIGRMTVLSKLMIRRTNMLGYRVGRRIEAYTTYEIGGLVGLRSESQRYAFINRMLKLRVMQRVDINGKSQYYINPAYFMSAGQRLSLDLFLLFREELAPIVPLWAMRSFLCQAREKEVPAVEQVEEIIRGE